MIHIGSLSKEQEREREREREREMGEKKHGGRRKGSGRKKKVEDRATVKTVSMPDHVWERLNDICTDRGILRSQVVREAVEMWLDANIQQLGK